MVFIGTSLMTNNVRGHDVGSLGICPCLVAQHISLKVSCNWVKLIWESIVEIFCMFLFDFFFFVSQFVIAVTERGVLKSL